MIYWFLQLATSDDLAQDVDVKTQSMQGLGGNVLTRRQLPRSRRGLRVSGLPAGPQRSKAGSGSCAAAEVPARTGAGLTSG